MVPLWWLAGWYSIAESCLIVFVTESVFWQMGDSDLDGRASPASNPIARTSLVSDMNGRASPNTDLDGRASSASDLVERASLVSNLDGKASPDTDLDERGKQLLATLICVTWL